MSSKAVAVGMKVLKTINSDVFQGLSVEAANENVNTLEAHTEVRKAWPMARTNLAPVRPWQTFASDAAAANYSIHQYTGVDKAHAAGMFGKGVTIAVVDTGTDYKHPAVGLSKSFRQREQRLTDLAWRGIRTWLQGCWWL